MKKRNIEIIQLSLYGENNKVLNSIDFSIDKLNIIVGRSGSGKTQLMKCVKYVLTGSKNNELDYQIVGDYTKYLQLKIYYNGKPLTIARENSLNSKKNNSNICFLTENHSDLIFTDDTNKITYDVIKSKYYLSVDKYISENNLSDYITGGNIMKYSFVNSIDFILSRNLIDLGNIPSYETAYLIYYIFNVFNDEKVEEYLRNNLSTNNSMDYSLEKDKIQAIRSFLNPDKKKNFSYKNKAEEVFSDLDNYIDENYQNTMNRISTLTNKKYTLDFQIKLLKKYKKNMESDAYKLFYNSLIKNFDSNLFDDILKKLIQEFEKDKVLINDVYAETKEQIAENKKLLEKYIVERRRINNEIEGLKNNINTSINDPQRSTKIRQIYNSLENKNLLNYRGSTNILSHEFIKESVRKNQRVFDKITTMNSSNLFKGIDYAQTLEQTVYQISNDNVMVEEYKLENTGSDFYFSMRKMLLLLSIHQFSDFTYDFIFLDQPFSRLSESKEEKKNNINTIITNLINEFSVESFSQLFIIESTDLILDEEDKLYISEQVYSDKVHIININDGLIQQHN